MTIPIPAANYDESPTTCVHINDLWIPVLLGALQAFLNPPQWGIDKNAIHPYMLNLKPIWEGDEEAQFLAEQQILNIMTALMLGNCEDDMPTGSVSIYVGTIAPEGWLLCDGASYEKAVYPSLWGVLSLHGAIFEEDSTHFIVPDLRGRTVIGAGEGAGLTNRLVGQFDGEETHLLEINEMPEHRHGLVVSDGATAVGSNDLALGDTPDVQGGYQTDLAGGDQPHNNMPPFFVLNFIIKT